MKSALKEQVKQHFSQIKLSSQQLEELENLANPRVGKGGHHSRRGRVYTGNLAIAGMFLVAIISIFMMSQFSSDVSKDMPHQIAEEVVKNHLKLKPLEVRAGTFNAIRGYFSKLEFMPVDSSMVSHEGMQLLGGRYCSLQGVTAAQLRMKKGKNLQTLYQTQYLPDVFGHIPQLEKDEAPLIVYARGVKVKIWVEKGLLFALTEVADIDQSQE